jgi:hypothetical protein
MTFAVLFGKVRTAEAGGVWEIVAACRTKLAEKRLPSIFGDGLAACKVESQGRAPG